MAAILNKSNGARAVRPLRPGWVAVQAGAALAAGVGVGRFAYTPILPLMHAQAGLTVQLGATVASANYVGYLIGALAGIAFPSLVRSRSALRASFLVLTATLALMPLTTDGAAWVALRLVAGVASALVFMIAVSAVLTALRDHGQHLTGWAFGGVGAGIALSGALVLVVRTIGTWQLAWWLVAALSLALAIPAWSLRTTSELPRPAQNRVAPARNGVAPAQNRVAPAQNRRIGPRWFGALFAAYTLEGVGYIIAGTFLVAAIDQSSPGWVGTSAWILVGLAALPSTALWAWLGRIWSRPTLLIAALILQAVGIVLPALLGGAGAALASAFLFGATFLGISTIALGIGAHLGTPRAVAILTTGYSAGQIAGPIIVAPLLHSGYQEALLVAGAIIALAAATAGFLRYQYPHHLGSLPVRVAAAAHRRAASPVVEPAETRPAQTRPAQTRPAESAHPERTTP